MNYRKIAEGFSLALLEMSHDLDFTRRKVEITDSAEMKELIVTLYVDVFKFLCYSLSWFTKKRNRLKASLNKNFYDETVERMVQAVQKRVQNIQNEASHATERRIMEIGKDVKQLLNLRSAAADSMVDNTTTAEHKLIGTIKDMQEALGNSSIRTLQAAEEQVRFGTLSWSSARVLLMYMTGRTPSTCRSTSNCSGHGRRA